MKKLILFLILLFLTAGLSVACGGNSGGDSGGSVTPPPIVEPEEDPRLKDPAFAPFDVRINSSNQLELLSVKDKTIDIVNIPSGTDVIYDNAFKGCENLTAVTFPDTLRSIRVSAFEGCPIETLEFPTSLGSISQYAFKDCKHLRSVTLPSTITNLNDSAFSGCYDLAEVVYDGDLPITPGYYHYGVARYAATVHSGESVLTLKDGYYWIPGDDDAILVGIADDPQGILELPSSFDGKSYKINRYFAAERKGITAVVIPDGVTEIGEYAFYGCDGIFDVTIGNGVSVIDRNAFPDSEIKKAALPASALKSDFLNFHKGQIVFLEITSGEELPAYGLASYYNLVSLTLPSTLKRLPEGTVCYDDKVLVEIIDRSGLVYDLESSEYDYTYITENALFLSREDDAESVIDVVDGYCFFTKESKVYLLGYLGNDEELVLPSDYNGETYEIYKYAFRYNRIKKLTIPEGITTIGEWAFSYSTQLEEVVAPSVTSIGDRAFDQCYKLYDENGYIIIADQLISYKAELKTEHIVVPDGVKAIKHFAFSHNDKLTSLTIPGSVKELGDQVVISCPNLTVLNLSEGLVKIGKNAFSGTKIESLVLPDSLTDMGNNAFAGCRELTSVVFGKGLQNIPVRAFADCSALESVTFKNGLYSIGDAAFTECSSLKAISFPEGLVEIGNGAFSWCKKLRTVAFPLSLKTIEQNAFRYCYDLYSVTLRSNLESISGYAFENCYSLVEVINKSSLDITAGSLSNGRVGYYAIRIHRGDSQGAVAGESYIRVFNSFAFISDANGKWYLVRYLGSLSTVTLPKYIEGNSYEVLPHALDGVEVSNG